MKKVFTSFLIFTGVFIGSFISSCDVLEELFLNLAVQRIVETDHTDGTYTDGTERWCFDSDSETFKEYRDDIESMTFLEASFAVIEFNPDPDLRCDLTVTVKNGSGLTLFSTTLMNVNPVDYIGKPYVFTLTETEISLINQYLSLLKNLCFEVTFVVDNMEPAAAPNKYIKGRVDIVIETKTSLK